MMTKSRFQLAIVYHLEKFETATECKKCLYKVTFDDQPGSHIVTCIAVKHSHIAKVYPDHDKMWVYLGKVDGEVSI